MANAAAPAGSSNIAFRTDDGAILRGWHFLPKNGGADRAPLIVLHHGFSGVKEFYLDKFADVFAEAGLGALVYDPRGFGDSEGRIRQEIDPFQQVSDFRDAISFGSTLPRVDPDRIGVWGCSYGGGVAIQATALDQRIGCIVVQVPFLSGGGYWSQVPPEARKHLSQIFAQDRRARATGQLPMMAAVAAEDTTKTLCVLPHAGLLGVLHETDGPDRPKLEKRGDFEKLRDDRQLRAARLSPSHHATPADVHRRRE